MNGDELVAEYFYARIWAVPAGIMLFGLNGWFIGMQNARIPMWIAGIAAAGSVRPIRPRRAACAPAWRCIRGGSSRRRAGIMLFGLNGWFIGMQNARIPMWIAILQNVVHVGCSWFFAFRCGMGIAGIGYGSVVAQYLGVALAAVLIVANYREFITSIDWSAVFDMRPIRRFLVVNRDIIVRTLCIVAVYTFFTGASARMEDRTLLAVNTILLQLFTLFSYMTDGFAQAAEALTGRFIGARDGRSLHRCIRNSIFWSLAVAAVFVGIYLVWWRDLLHVFTLNSPESSAYIIATAGDYIGWIIAIPIASSLPFLMDGIMVGATRTRVMRDSMILSTIIYFAIFFAFSPLIGNNALWCAFLLYMLLRGVLQYFMTHRLKDIYRQADAA